MGKQGTESMSKTQASNEESQEFYRKCFGQQCVMTEPFSMAFSLLIQVFSEGKNAQQYTIIF